MVPVERATVELAGEPPQPGARVEHERPRLAVVRQRDARRVPADAYELATRARRRTAHPAEEQPHAFVLAAVARTDLLEHGAVELVALARRPPGTS